MNAYERLAYLNTIGYPALGRHRTCSLNLIEVTFWPKKETKPNVQFPEDIFHCNKHKEPTCFSPDNPLCKYHPSLERFKEIHGVNTESANKAFSWLSRFKYTAVHSSQRKFRVFVHVITERRNRRIQKELCRKKLM